MPPNKLVGVARQRGRLFALAVNPSRFSIGEYCELSTFNVFGDREERCCCKNFSSVRGCPGAIRILMDEFARDGTSTLVVKRF